MEGRNYNYTDNRGFFAKSSDTVKAFVLAIYSFFYLFFYSLIYPVNRNNSGNNSGGSNRGFRSSGSRPEQSPYGSCFKFKGMGGG